MLRRLADALTLIRLVCSPALFALQPDGAAFWTLYAALGLTDALDGPFARASRQGPTERGAKLDSAADAVLFGTPVFVHFAGAWGILPALAAASAAAASQFAVRKGR